MNKRGFEVAFSWIFAIIAGISIFLFLSWFAVRQTDLFGVLSAQTATEELDIAFTIVRDNLVSTKLEFKRDVKLEFKCDDNTLGEEKVFINGKAGKKLKGNIVFAPNSLNGNTFELFTVSWNAPFRVANFILLNSNGDTYNLISAPVDLKLPDNFNFYGGDKKIEFYNGLSDYCSASGVEIYYEKDLDLDEYYGTICIGRRNYNFVGDAMIYAAIFSDSSNFGCLYNKALEKYSNMKNVYLEKSMDLRNSDGSLCSYGNLVKDDMEKLIEQEMPELDRIKNVKKRNDALLRVECEALY